ncbi:MAG TPA: LysM peptidoglycan-binding domain-containing protein [Anaerolineae bacterium]|nr:LysM peptidoglycan-binding domain-containing protein [Anaerolineae bacterium]
MVHRAMPRWFICLLICLCYLLDNSIVQAEGDPANQIIRLVNELRASYGPPAYEVDNILMSVAQAQANWSAANDHIGHDGPGGSSPNDRAQAAGYGGGSRSFATENVAYGTASINTPEFVVNMWQGDWGHLNAMISPDYEHIGVGFAEANGYSWYVMMVGWVADDSYSGNTNLQETPEVSMPYVPFILSEPDENGAIYHEVQPGQTAWTIAAYYEVDLVELLALNHLTENSILHPGDVLLVCPPESPTSTPPSHLVSEVALPSPTVPAQIYGVSPPATISVVSQNSQRSSVIPLLLILGGGITTLAGFALARISRARAHM